MKEKYQVNIGDVFNRLLVIDMFKKPRKQGSIKQYVCKCECGNIIDATCYSLVKGKTKSCGCWKKQAIAKASTKHGEYRTHLHNIWRGMKERCANPNHAMFRFYGGRGITVIKDWFDSYLSFKSWAESIGYNGDERLTIERIDNDKGYEPSNCTFVSKELQALHRRNTITVPYRGEMRTISEIAKITGMGYQTVYYGYFKSQHKAKKKSYLLFEYDTKGQGDIR